MSLIRCRDTRPEQALLSIIQPIAAGRWPLLTNVNRLPGRPDVFVPSLRLVVFADGCFYHSCPIHGHIPKTNAQYWQPKLQRTVYRDRRVRQRLRRKGFRVWRVWVHDLKSAAYPRTARRLARRLRKLAGQTLDL